MEGCSHPQNLGRCNKDVMQSTGDQGKDDVEISRDTSDAAPLALEFTCTLLRLWGCRMQWERGVASRSCRHESSVLVFSSNEEDQVAANTAGADLSCKGHGGHPPHSKYDQRVERGLEGQLAQELQAGMDGCPIPEHQGVRLVQSEL